MRRYMLNKRMTFEQIVDIVGNNATLIPQQSEDVQGFKLRNNLTELYVVSYKHSNASFAGILSWGHVIRDSKEHKEKLIDENPWLKNILEFYREPETTKLGELVL